jgi:hypothetical protein
VQSSDSPVVDDSLPLSNKIRIYVDASRFDGSIHFLLFSCGKARFADGFANIMLFQLVQSCFKDVHHVHHLFFYHPR